MQSSTDLEPLVVTAEEAARITTMSRQYMSILANAGDIPSIKIGRRRLFRVSDLDAWIEKHREGKR